MPSSGTNNMLRVPRSTYKHLTVEMPLVLLLCVGATVGAIFGFSGALGDSAAPVAFAVGALAAAVARAQVRKHITTEN